MKRVVVVFLIMIMSIQALQARVIYLSQTIKSPKNLICIYKDGFDFYAVNFGNKSYCPNTYNTNKIVIQRY